MQKTIKTSLILGAFLSQLNAQNINLQPITITSTAIVTDELKSSDAVEVYTAKDIENAHVQNVYEFLNQQTSITAMPSYGNPFIQKLDLHGFGIGDGYQNIVVTINGRRINNIDMVAPLVSSISPASVEKIEIIKSSGIVTGGDGANAGVINITTKKNNDKEVGFYGGTYGVADASFYFGHSDKKLTLGINGETQKSSGIRTVNAQGDKDQSKLSTGTFNLTYTPMEELAFRLGASFARTDITYGGYLTKSEYEKDTTQAGATNWGASQQKYDTDSLNAGVSYFANDKLSFHFDAANERKKSNYITYASVSNYTYNSQKLHVDYADNFLTLTSGIETFEGKRVSEAKESTKNNLAAFVMGSASFGTSSFKAGARVEKVNYKYKDTAADLHSDKSLFGAELGYNQTLNQENSLFVNYAHSYQAPDIDRFFTITYPAPTYTATVDFNGFINPSQTDSLTLGYNSITPTNKLKLSLYYVSLKDEIYYYAGINYVGAKNTNIDKSHKYGLDLYDKYIINDMFNIILNYNYVQAKIDDEKENGEDYSGKDLPGVSNHNAKATLNYLPNPHAAIALTQTYRSEAFASDDFSNSFSQKQDAYVSTDISATYAKKSWEIFAKINNLFNQKNGLWTKNDAIYPVNFTTTAIAGLKLKY